ncbi:flagellar biosynthesis protein FlhF [Paraburkholderia sp. CNPSo 3274]|uniref:flagellar biosynthesis protein FlhF n=1 Tax=Paraburkholderia sp. CNPSo 3274 TaxID=2940932 RepID=UPI0020B86F96|nr:flagellar biosynthesis protein FlhF [Paraburkholderia sp. CNPSo 3274]MCP3712550.1 flagellar biosynthesis protein FlhF [Paraburkholderia sp. CNPSo 3274]
MNIRKFIGGTSRDALRLVREALGADAVVLSNRTLDDGSVEIVALADRDLAAIAPADAAAAQGLGGLAAQGGQGAPFAQPSAAMTQMPRTPRSTPGAAVAALAAPIGGANPYASGMPDVFSSVFGASPEVGVENGGASADADGDHAADTAVSLGQEAAAVSAAIAPLSPSSRAAAGQQAAQSAMPPTLQSARQAAQLQQAVPHAHSPLQMALQAATESLASPAFAPSFASTAPAANTSAPAAAREAAARLEQAAGAPASDAPRTMAESNPWLIDHARRIANQQNAPRVPGMTPAAAAARGLGSVADPVLPPGVDASTPDWALEAAHVAARRAAQRLGHGPEAAGPAPGNRHAQGADGANAAQTVSEAIRTRIEQVVNETVMNELASMRGMMEEQFAGLLWGERQRRSPVQGALTKQLFAAGFSAQLVKMMIDRLPEVETEEAGMEWLQSVLESNLPVLEDEEALMERGGVFALMGPTGVGKTTTTAKLAARCVMRFGASKVALLTTDSYRIGGHEQLRIFGKILGVSVHAVRDGADLQLALTELKNKHIVLIDTIGMSQRDRAVADQIAMLCGAGRPVQRLLLLSATNHGDTLNEVVQAYQSGPDNAPLTGCILTKLDEATNLGSALDTVLRYKLPVHYVSTGQKVPENLYVATRRFLIRSAFCIPRESSPFVPHEDDIPALLSALSTRSNSQAPEVRFG